MIDYTMPEDDIYFALKYGADAARLPTWDDELARELVVQAGRFVNAEIAPLDVEGDQTPARLVDGRVKMPESFGRAYARFREGGWPGMAAAEAYGGMGLPHVLAAAVSEMLSGACLSYQMVLSLAQGAQRTLAANGSQAQKDRYLPRLVSGEWLATMCLTEPQAGSDLGRIRTLARPEGDHWRLHGDKIFISGGDQNLTEGVLHLVLARTPDAPEGLKGLSLFLCPSVLEDGRRNAVAAARLEEKMGLHASPTCQMVFDGAEAELIGAPGQGLAQMFTMMNAERLDVALQGVGLAEVAGQRSRAYAAERKQGRAPAGDTIAAHGDVQRMLLTQLALTEGCRAMIYRAMVELELDERSKLVEFLTPVYKAFATDAGVEAAQLAIQIHGGYGYLREYRVEQILRDARITPIYEGTNGIQAMTLAGRLLRLESGAHRQAFEAFVQDAIDEVGDQALAVAFADWQRAAGAVLEAADPGLIATSFLRLTGLLCLGVAWARLEAAAEQAPNPGRTRAVAAFVREWLLPETAHLAALIARHQGSTSLEPALLVS
jgi:alkylation response protein AidB-like acyl-CoA dehydrogenase